MKKLKRIMSIVVLVTIIASAFLATSTVANACNLPHFNTRSGVTPWILQNGRPHFESSVDSGKYISALTRDIDINRYNSYFLAGDNSWNTDYFKKVKSTSNHMGVVDISDRSTLSVDFEATINPNTNHVTSWSFALNDVIAYEAYVAATMGDPKSKQLKNLFSLGFGLVAGLGFRENLDCVMKNRNGYYEVTSGDAKGMSVVTHTHEHSDVGQVNGECSYDSTTRHEVICNQCLAYTYQPHVTSSYLYKATTSHYKVCKCGYKYGTEAHSFTDKNGMNACISCGYMTSDPVGGVS